MSDSKINPYVVFDCFMCILMIGHSVGGLLEMVQISSLVESLKIEYN